MDRFATWANRLLPRFNSAVDEPHAEALDALAQTDQHWRGENNWVHPPFSQLEAVVSKLQRSGAAATVVAPRFEGAFGHQQLVEMAEDVAYLGRKADTLFLPGWQPGQGQPGTRRWPLALYRIPLRAPGRRARTP